MPPYFKPGKNIAPAWARKLREFEDKTHLDMHNAVKVACRKHRDVSIIYGAPNLVNVYRRDDIVGIMVGQGIITKQEHFVSSRYTAELSDEEGITTHKTFREALHYILVSRRF